MTITEKMQASNFSIKVSNPFLLSRKSESFIVISREYHSLGACIKYFNTQCFNCANSFLHLFNTPNHLNPLLSVFEM